MADVETTNVSGVATTQAKDENTLAEIGYKQELKRNWSLLHNFGVSFSIIVSICDPFLYLLLWVSSSDAHATP